MRFIAPIPVTLDIGAGRKATSGKNVPPTASTVSHHRAVVFAGRWLKYIQATTKLYKLNPMLVSDSDLLAVTIPRNVNTRLTTISIPSATLR
jgi:hypothetical protein